MGKAPLKKFILPLVSVILTAAFPAIFLYAANASEAGFNEVLKPLGLFLLVGILFFIIFILLTKSPQKASLISVVFVLAFSNFTLLEEALEAVFPSLRYWHTVGLVLLLWIHIALAICLFAKQEVIEIGNLIVPIVFGVLIVINLATAIPAVVTKVGIERQTEGQEEATAIADTTESEDLPNIYLLIFDEYAGFKQIQEYYNYDNQQLVDLLEEKQFTISYDSHNESINTATVTTNLVNLDYVVEFEDPAAEKDYLRENGALFSLLAERGYDIRKLSGYNTYGEDYPIGDFASDSSAQTISGDTLETLLLKNTMLYPFLVEEIVTVNPELQFVSDPANIPTDPTFTIMHVLLPHQPFYYQEDGTINSPNNWENWRDDEYYLGQYKYTTDLMCQAITTLVENDPDSLIMVMSDHGARASSDDELFMEKFPLDIMSNILNAFYYKGEDLSEYVDLSGANTIRMLLNKTIGTNFEKVEVPVDYEERYK